MSSEGEAEAAAESGPGSSPVPGPAAAEREEVSGGGGSRPGPGGLGREKRRRAWGRGRRAPRRRAPLRAVGAGGRGGDPQSGGSRRGSRSPRSPAGTCSRAAGAAASSRREGAESGAVRSGAGLCAVRSGPQRGARRALRRRGAGGSGRGLHSRAAAGCQVLGTSGWGDRLSPAGPGPAGSPAAVLPRCRLPPLRASPCREDAAWSNGVYRVEVCLRERLGLCPRGAYRFTRVSEMVKGTAALRHWRRLQERQDECTNGFVAWNCVAFRCLGQRTEVIPLIFPWGLGSPDA